MAASSQSSVNLGLPAVPETTDSKLFQELVRVYNAIRILAQGLDDYTGGGTVITTVETVDIEAASAASFSQLSKKYYKYKVPTFTVTGKLGINGKLPQAAYVFVAPLSVSPAGGVGTAAGGFDTAANRDAAIVAINRNKVAIEEIKTALIAIGIGA